MTPTSTSPQAGVLQVYCIPHTLHIFDIMGATDPLLSDGARGMLWRILAQVKIHGPDWKVELEALFAGSPEHEMQAKSHLRELHKHGYVRRFQDHRQDGTPFWVVEAAEQPIFENDKLKPDIATFTHPAQLVPAPQKKRSRIASDSKPKKKPSQALPGLKELKAWWLAPVAEGGRGQVVADRQWSGWTVGANTILEIAIKRGWIRVTETVGDSAYDMLDFLDYLNACCDWIEKNKPYKGSVEIHNIGTKVQVWWEDEGRQNYESIQPDYYMPVSI